MHLFITGGSARAKARSSKASCTGSAARFTASSPKGPDSPLGSEIRMFPAGGRAGFPIAVCRSENVFVADVAALDEFGAELL